MILHESYVNVFTPEDKEEYYDIVVDILNQAYAPLGGAKGLSKDKLLRDDVFWKLVRKGGNIIACAIYTFKKASDSRVTFFDPRRDERKLKYIGSDGSPEGVQGVKAIMSEDINRPERGFWAEISGSKMEYMYIQSRGAIPIPSKIADEVLKKFKHNKPEEEINEFDPDGYHYWRMIGGQNLRKMMIGNANIMEQGLGRPELADIYAETPDYEYSEENANLGESLLDFVMRAREN